MYRIAVEEVAPHVRMYKSDVMKVLKTYKNAHELAKEMGIPVENFKDTFDRYNYAAKTGWCPSAKPRFPVLLLSLLF